MSRLLSQGLCTRAELGVGDTSGHTEGQPPLTSRRPPADFVEESSSGRERVSFQFDILLQMIQGDGEFPERTFQIPHIMPPCDRCPESTVALDRSSKATGRPALRQESQRLQGTVLQCALHAREGRARPRALAARQFGF